MHTSGTGGAHIRDEMLEWTIYKYRPLEEKQCWEQRGSVGGEM